MHIKLAIIEVFFLFNFGIMKIPINKGISSPALATASLIYRLYPF